MPSTRMWTTRGLRSSAPNPGNATTCSSYASIHAAQAASSRRSGRGAAIRAYIGRWARPVEARLAQEGRDVEIVVADLERRALAVVDPRAAVARAALALRAGGAQAGAVEARGDDRHADLVGQAVVDHGAEDDVGVRVGRGVDDLRRLVDLEQAEVLTAGDVE